MDLKTIVKVEMVKQGITSKDLARKIGVSPTSLYDTLRRNPTLSSLQRIAKALDVKLGIYDDEGFHEIE